MQLADDEENDIDVQESIMRDVREQSFQEMNDGMDDDEALQTAMRNSMEPRAKHEHMDVVDSVEVTHGS